MPIQPLPDQVEFSMPGMGDVSSGAFRTADAWQAGVASTQKLSDTLTDYAAQYLEMRGVAKASDPKTLFNDDGSLKPLVLPTDMGVESIAFRKTATAIYSQTAIVQARNAFAKAEIDNPANTGGYKNATDAYMNELVKKVGNNPLVLAQITPDLIAARGDGFTRVYDAETKIHREAIANLVGGNLAAGEKETMTYTDGIMGATTGKPMMARGGALDAAGTRIEDFVTNQYIPKLNSLKASDPSWTDDKIAIEATKERQKLYRAAIVQGAASFSTETVNVAGNLVANKDGASQFIAAALNAPATRDLFSEDDKKSITSDAMGRFDQGVTSHAQAIAQQQSDMTAAFQIPLNNRQQDIAASLQLAENETGDFTNFNAKLHQYELDQPKSDLDDNKSKVINQKYVADQRLAQQKYWTETGQFIQPQFENALKGTRDNPTKLDQGDKAYKVLTARFQNIVNKNVTAMTGGQYTDYNATLPPKVFDAATFDSNAGIFYKTGHLLPHVEDSFSSQLPNNPEAMANAVENWKNLSAKNVIFSDDVNKNMNAAESAGSNYETYVELRNANLGNHSKSDDIWTQHAIDQSNRFEADATIVGKNASQAAATALSNSSVAAMTLNPLMGNLANPASATIPPQQRPDTFSYLLSGFNPDASLGFGMVPLVDGKPGALIAFSDKGLNLIKGYMVEAAGPARRRMTDIGQATEAITKLGTGPGGWGLSRFLMVNNDQMSAAGDNTIWSYDENSPEKITGQNSRTLAYASSTEMAKEARYTLFKEGANPDESMFSVARTIAAPGSPMFMFLEWQAGNVKWTAHPLSADDPRGNDANGHMGYDVFLKAQTGTGPAWLKVNRDDHPYIFNPQAVTEAEKAGLIASSQAAIAVEARQSKMPQQSRGAFYNEMSRLDAQAVSSGAGWAVQMGYWAKQFMDADLAWGGARVKEIGAPLTDPFPTTTRPSDYNRPDPAQHRQPATAPDFMPNTGPGPGGRSGTPKNQ